jgi:hypothetical protein
MKIYEFFLISDFRHVLKVVCFILGDSPASESHRRKHTIYDFINNNRWKTPKYFADLLRPSSGRCFTKDILQRQHNVHI